MAFPTLGVIDDFNRGDEGPPMTGWVDCLNGLEVVSNEAQGSQAAAYSFSFWNDSDVGPDSEAYFTIRSAESMGPWARGKDIGASNTVDGYVAWLNWGGSYLRCYRLDNGVYTALGADAPRARALGDKVGIESIGTTIKIYYKDGAAAWAEKMSRTDGTYTAAGYIGVDMRNNGLCDDFGGGTIGVERIPRYGFTNFQVPGIV